MSSARRFQLVRELGSGAFGTVYLAEMESGGGFRRRVALKLLRPEVEEASDASRRLRDEARLLGRLRHRNIVQVDDLVWVNGRWAVVMEYVSGQDLEVVLARLGERGERVPALAAVELARAVATALDAAWSGGEEPMRVVHRDIKPSNVRLTEEGEVKVLDFGIARAEFEGREARTGRVRYGSVGYMAPERLLGGEEGPAGDVYAVGCLLAETLCGKALGRAELAPDKQAAQVEAACARVREVLAEQGASVVVEGLCAALTACLAYEEEDRPTARALALTLGDLVRQTPGEDLGRFARRVLPGLAAEVPGQPVQGTLVEVLPHTRGAAPVPELPAPAPAVDQGSLTFSFAGVEEDLPALSPSAAPDPGEPAAPARPRAALWAGVVGAALVLLVGGLFLPQLAGSGAGGSGGPAPASLAGPAAGAEPAVGPTQPGEPTPAPPPLGAGPASPGTAGAAAGGADPGASVDPSAAGAAAAGASAGAPVGRPVGASKPVAVPSAPVVSPAAAPDAALPTEASAPSGERVRSAKFTVSLASRVKAVCGDRSASGTSSALVRDFVPGACRVEATLDGVERSAVVEVDQARGVTCTFDAEVLQCR